MAKTYRGGLIGCGYVSRSHLAAWSRIEEAEIIAVSNRTREKAERRAEEFDVPAVYSDYRSMLDTEQLDFVDIATPPSVHLEMVAAAAKRGLPVLCQKPIAATLAELQEMMRICDEAGVSFMVNENCRFQPWFRKMKALIDQGVIGEPCHATFLHRSRTTLPTLHPGDQVDLFANMVRLINYELGVHYLDTLRYLFGEPDSVYAQMRQLSPHVMGEDLATVMVKLSDVTAVVDMSWALIPTWEEDKHISWGEYRIEGTGGTLHLHMDGLLRILTDGAEEQIQFPSDSIIRSYQATQHHFIECLRTDAKPETSGPETLKTMELVFGAYNSATHNRVYRVGRDRKRLE